ncbi:MAG: hypothetical protein OXT65_07695 [Alphaproteobacteria bacterium]|nr:hypothetical protein [Alphaproteobacteria bacterium]
MALFSKEETKQRMIEKRAELRPESADADFNKALVILGSSLYEKKLWNGDDYGHHPVHVSMTKTDSSTKMIIGLLHDVVEDSDWTIQDLRDVGFSERVVNGVDAMTRREGEAYFSFIARCSLNSDGIDCKIKDLQHNMDMSRGGPVLGQDNLMRLNKYHVSLSYLIAVKKGDVKAGSSVADFVAANDNLNNNKIIADIVTKNSPPPPVPRPRSQFPKI